jgi:hypothetical protein
MSKNKTGTQWEKLKDDQLLEKRFCDLDLKISGSRVEPMVEQLYAELAAKGLLFQPHVWVSEDWFSADGIPGIAIPFFVVSERLARLERRLILEVEGYRPKECMKLLRHEAGHAIDNAFRLRKSRQRQQLFGLSSTPYPEAYSPRAYSRKFVVHLNSWYAQSHPDEDWAETFAVWLNPQSNWKKRYHRWPALKKLELVDQMMAGIVGRKPPVRKKQQPGLISRSRKKLKTHYQNKKDYLGLDEPFYLDPLLMRLFSNSPEFKKRKRAASFIRQERQLISGMVARWTGQYKYTINLMLSEVIQSCQEKKLHLTKSERETRLDLVGMLTAQTLNYISSGHHTIAM